tara:strand:+ start:120 stop:344 length:225 start_codon:yes stop_codon:yes gene_type:complete
MNNRKQINEIENAVRNISILSNNLKECKESIEIKNNILLIEANMHELVHISDLINMNKQSDYYIDQFEEVSDET